MIDPVEDANEAVKIVSTLLYLAYETALENLLAELPPGPDDTNCDELAEIARIITTPGFRLAFERCTRFRNPGEKSTDLLVGMREAVKAEKQARAARRKIVALPTSASPSQPGGQS